MVRIATERSSPKPIALNYTHGFEARRRFRPYPCTWPGHDGISNLGACLVVRLPDAARNENFPRRKVQIEAWGVHVLRCGMMEVCAGIRLVGALVGRESDISVDAKHGTANRPWVRNIVATDAAQTWSEITDKLQHRIANGRLV